MLSSTFWTQRRFTGIALILGYVLFLVAAFLPVTNSKDTFHDHSRAPAALA